MKSSFALLPIASMMATGATMLPALAPIAVAKEQVDPGKRLFLQCRACHTLAPGEPHKVGPNLGKILGAKAAQKPGYKYSKALSQSGLVWDYKTMDHWIENPSAVLVGHKMVYFGMKDPAQRRMLIRYLSRETKSGDPK